MNMLSMGILDFTTLPATESSNIVKMVKRNLEVSMSVV